MRARAMLVVLLLAILALFAFKPHRRPAAASVEPGAEPSGLEIEPIHELRHRDFAGGDEYLIRNLIAGPIEVECALQDASNIESVPRLPRHLVLPALAEAKLTELRGISTERPASASIRCDASLGDPRARPADDVAYAIPFHADTRFALNQGFNGVFSHHDAQTRYALDFAVAEGTPVLAARDGVVMQVESNFRANGGDVERFGDRANYVRVLHGDGSMAVYAHLAPRSAVLRPGEQVRAGDMIGRSGNTGYSTGPHLHFAVQKNAGMALLSIPFRMPGIDTGGPR